MKRNLFSLASAAAFVLAVVFAGCTREEVKDDKDGVSTVTLKISMGESRAEGAIVATNTAPTFATGWIFFTNGVGQIVAAEEIGGGGTAIADLTTGTGATFVVPASASAVHVFGTVDDVAAWPTQPIGKPITAYTDVTVTVPDLFSAGTVAQIPLYGTASIVDDDQSSNPNDFMAKPTVTLVASRVEIKSIAMQETATSGVTSFKVKNIFVNYYYPGLTLLGSTASGFTLQNNGSDPLKYVAAAAADYKAGGYDSDKEGMLYDAVDKTSADATPDADREGVVPSTGSVWGYNLLPLAAGSYFPHFVIEISDIDVVNDSSPEYEKYEKDTDNATPGHQYPTYYLTVKGVASTSKGSLDLEQGNVYHIEEVLFSLSDLSPLPEPSDKNVRCLVTITKWVATTVTPSF